MIEVVIIIFLLSLSALFSASELAIFSSPLYKIKQIISGKKSTFANLLMKLRDNRERTLITILVGNNLINVILTIYASGIGNELISGFAISAAVSFFIISFTITTFILIFGEIVPKVFATRYSLIFALFISPLIDILSKLLFPIVFVLEILMKSLNSFFTEHGDYVSKDDVEVFIEDGKKQGIFSNIESMIIKNLFDFNERSVESILRHRTEVLALPSDITLEDGINKILEFPYSRIPIFNYDKDNIIGLLTLRDFLYYYHKDSNNSYKKLGDFDIRPVFKLPITANVFDVFLNMKKTGNHFSIVVDEYGGTAGIITFEDILEDMVGDIRDESDHKEEENIVKIGVNELLVRGDVLLRDILKAFNIEDFEIPDDLKDKFNDDDMISYIILTMLQSFAKKGDIVNIGNIHFKVSEISSEGDKILKVKAYYNGK